MKWWLFRPTISTVTLPNCSMHMLSTQYLCPSIQLTIINLTKYGLFYTKLQNDVKMPSNQRIIPELEVQLKVSHQCTRFLLKTQQSYINFDLVFLWKRCKTETETKIKVKPKTTEDTVQSANARAVIPDCLMATQLSCELDIASNVWLMSSLSCVPSIDNNE